MSKQSGQSLLQRARKEAQAVAVGPFTPLAFERYEYIGGERGWRLGYPIECGGGPGIVWSDRSQWPGVAALAAREAR